ncbi:MAG: hypothetical protein WCQ16_12195 [Verrucomicrobiae bacterium]
MNIFDPMLAWNRIISAVLWGICAFSSATASARLGNWPEYDQLAKADVVALFSVDGVTPEYGIFSGINLRVSKTVPAPLVLKGEQKAPLEYSSEEFLFPKGTRTHMVFLGADADGKLVPVNWMCSTISSTCEFDRLAAGAGDCWDVLRKMFRQETNPDLALLQARVIATGPALYAKSCLVEPQAADGDELWLAHFLVSLYAESEQAVDLSRGPFRDISKIGVTDKGTGGMAFCARGAIEGWFYRNASSENSSQLLDFILLQKGSFQGNLLIAIAKFVPEARLPDIARLMRKSRHNLVRYGCFKVINYRLNGGRGICGIDDFSRHPDRYLDRAEQLLKAR